MEVQMLAKYVQRGHEIDFIPEADVAAGDVIIIGDLVGIAKLDIKVGTLGSLTLVGVFDIPKATGESTAIPVGTIVFWDAENSQVTTTGGDNKYLGKTIIASSDNDAHARVIINVSRDVPISATGAITDPEAGAEHIDDQSGGTASGTHQLAAVADTSTDQSGTINNNFATIGAEYNSLKDDVEANNGKIDSILVALRTLGLIATE
jgi:predicted RecA/RadA family phage recombinase